MVHPSGKIAVIKGSIFKYIEDSLRPVFGTGAIDYGGGAPFNDASLSYWLQPRVMEPARPTTLIGPTSEGNLFGREMYHMLNLNIFVRPAKVSPSNRFQLETLRDATIPYFQYPSRIPVRDYSTDSATIGNLVAYDIIADRPVPAPDKEQELLQWNMVVALRWTEEWLTS